LSTPSEFRVITRHAGTVLVGQVAVMAFGLADTVVAGRYADSALAALSVGSAVFISVFVALLGVMQALLPVWAELHGSGRQAQVGVSVRQSLYLCAVTIVTGLLILLNPGPVLEWTRVPEALRPEVEAYLGVLALALPPALLFRMFSTLNQSLGKPRLVTWLQIGSLFVKVPLSIWFTFGGFGLPAGGVVGCAWATLVVNYLMFGTALWLLRTQALYRPYQLWRRMERPDWPALGQFARMGVPGGLAIMVEVTSFTLMALFIARMGTTASAAHQIAANMAGLLYMVPLSLGIAASARVSFWLGAGDATHARLALATGLRLTMGIAVVLAAAMFLLRAPLASLYSGNPAVVAMASGLLAWAALYHVADAMQAICVFLLRCYRVTIAPLVVYCVLLWGLGLAGGYVLAYGGAGIEPWRGDAATFWITSAVALWITGLAFLALLRRASVQRHN
jgi:MATE family multidrug resistance protein